MNRIYQRFGVSLVDMAHFWTLSVKQKAVREAAFADAIVSEQTAPLSSSYDPNNINLDSSVYSGPHPGSEGLSTDMDFEASLFAPGKLPRAFCIVSTEWVGRSRTLFESEADG